MRIKIALIPFSNRVYDVVPLFPRALTNLIGEYAMLGMEDHESVSSILSALLESLKKSHTALHHPRLLENGPSEENKDDQENGLLPVNAKQAQPKRRQRRG
jgi:hypothetical protein